jgi:pimeloyl-ACP methyl ester carboxylesterase
MARAQVDGIELWYELKGSGPYLVQIGGAVSAHEGYVTVTDAMSEHFTVIDYDHRGYGQSDRPSGRYTMATWADDLASLLDAIGVERTHIHGGSMGGFIATLFAARYPERVERLVISGAIAKCDQMARMQFEIWKAIARSYGTDSTSSPWSFVPRPCHVPSSMRASGPSRCRRFARSSPETSAWTSSATPATR